VSNPRGLANVIFTIHLYARRKNGFDLGPYLSDDRGVVTITEADMRDDVDATYDSGLMDYVSVENCHTFMEIRLETEEHIRQALHSRETVWKNLLKGEKERWGSMENLLRAYRESSNCRLNVHEGFSAASRRLGWKASRIASTSSRLRSENEEVQQRAGEVRLTRGG